MCGVWPAFPSSSFGDFFMLFVGDGVSDGVADVVGEDVSVGSRLPDGVDVTTTLGVGAAFGVVFELLTKIVTTPAPKTITIRAASSLWALFRTTPP